MKRESRVQCPGNEYLKSDRYGTPYREKERRPITRAGHSLPDLSWSVLRQEAELSRCIQNSSLLVSLSLHAVFLSALPFTAVTLEIVRTLALSCTMLASLILGIVSVLILLGGDIIAFTALQPFAGFSLSFVVDRLAAFFLLIIAAVTGCVALYATEYGEHLDGGSRRNLFAGCMNLFILAMVLVVASANTLSFFFFWELMAASSFILVMYEYDHAETRKAGIFYFIMTQLSTMFVLFGILALSFQTGSFSFSAAGSPAALLVIVAFLSLFTGFSIKGGIIPFHKWLPYAHPASPTPVSALMSGVMLKIAVYGLVRFLLDVFSPDLSWGS